MTSAPDQNQQFEQVLSRLDALMKRGQASTPFTPPSPVDSPALEEAGSDPLPSADELASEQSSTPFVILEEPAEIPVLTEIYEGDISDAGTTNDSELAEAVVDALMPLMLENLDIIVAEEAARMQQNIAARLRNEIAATLRERLQQKP